MKLTINNNAYREKTWARIKLARDAAEGGGFLYNGVKFDSDPTSVQRISGAVTLAMLAQTMGTPYSQDWIVADNSTMALDAQGMISVGIALGMHVKAVFDRSKAVRAEIAAATTAAQLDAIVW